MNISGAANSNSSFNSCCRMCLVENASTLSNIFSARNESCGIVEKIYSVTGIKIISTDRISTNLCDKCFLLINNFDNFKSKCASNQHVLTKRLHYFDTLLVNESIQIKDEPPDEVEEDIIFLSNQDDLSSIKEEPVLDITIDARDDDLPPLLSPNLPTAHELLQNIEPTVATEESIDTGFQATDPIDSEEARIAQIEAHIEEIIVDDQRDKIDFAAGLQLQSRMIQTVNADRMTKAELQYTKKHILVYSQFLSLKCCCHNEVQPMRKTLISHCKRYGGPYLMPYTCLSCFATFKGASGFQIHRRICKKKEFEGFYQIYNAEERDVNKHRSYQIFTCSACVQHYRTYEDYCKHVDIHVLELGLQCLCGNNFNSTNAFKQHLYNSCTVKYTCDICYKGYDSVEEFKDHCTQIHDDDEGPQFKVADGFVLYEFPIETLYACVECNLKCAKAQVLAKHLQSEHTYDVDHSIKVAADCYIGPSAEDENIVTINNNDVTDKPKSDQPLPKAKAKPKTKFECDICFKSFGSNANLSRHKQGVHYMKRHGNVRCGDCKEKFNSVTELQTHLESHHSFPCVECGTKYKTFEELDKHRSIHLKISLTRDPNTMNYRSNLSIQNEDELDQHMQEYPDGMPTIDTVIDQDLKVLKMQCKLCKLLFATKRGLSIHLTRSHPDALIHRDAVNDFPKQCNLCGVTIRDMNSWFLHMKMHPPVASSSSDSNSPVRPDETDYYTCKKCFKVFATTGSYKQHLRVHGIVNSPSKKYWCSICKVSCHTQIEWARHKEVHKKKTSKSMACNHCKVSFDNKNELKEHMLNEHDVKLSGAFDCNICGKQLYSTESLRGHIGWHKRPSKYMIKSKSPPTLIRVDAEPPKLQINTKSLFKKKTYVCITCGNLFPNQQNLQAHITSAHSNIATMDNERIHNIKLDPEGSGKSNEYNCKLCAAVFPSMYYLRGHLEKEHPSTPYVPKGSTTCPYCQMNFKKSNALASHMNMHKRKNHKLPSKLDPVVSNAQVKHLPEFKFNCSICGRGFNIPAELRSHIIAQHPF